METPQHTLADVIKNLENGQKTLAKTMTKITLDHTKRIEDLIYRCAALEAIQIRLFSVLAETNSSIHARLVEELNDSLKHIEGKGGIDSPYADHLRALVGSKPGKKVHLKLVPKKASVEPLKPKPS